MKAIDDSWEYISGGWPYDVFRQGTNKKIADVWGDGIEDTHAAANLIAAAPEMARLLLERFAKYAECDSGNDSSDWYCGWCHYGGRHAPDCRLLAVLRKAGVLP